MEKTKSLELNYPACGHGIKCADLQGEVRYLSYHLRTLSCPPMKCYPYLTASSNTHSCQIKNQNMERRNDVNFFKKKKKNISMRQAKEECLQQDTKSTRGKH